MAAYIIQSLNFELHKFPIEGPPVNEIVIQTFLISLHFSKGLENANGESTRAH